MTGLGANVYRRAVNSTKCLSALDKGLRQLALWYNQLNIQLFWSSLVVCFCIFITIWLFYSFLMKPFMSPLRKIPGMAYNPIFGNMKEFLAGEAMEFELKLIRRFGPLCRYYSFGGGERVLVADPELFRKIMVTNSRSFIKSNKSTNIKYLILNRIFGKTSLLTINGKDHLMKRKVMNPAFTSDSVRKMLPVLLTKAVLLRDKWIQNARDAKDGPAECRVHMDLNNLALDVIGEVAFSHQFNSLMGKISQLHKAMRSVMSFKISPATIAMLFWENLPLSEAKALKHNMQTLDQTIMDIIVKRHQLHQKLGEEGSDRVVKDLLGMLLSTKPGSQGLSFKELRDQIATIIFAGRGTSSATLAWCLLCLAQHQDVQDRLRAEVRQHVTRPDGQPWDGQNVEKMQYLDCVVKETLRLFPAIPSVSRQAVRDETLGAYFIPAGTTVTLAVGAMMRRPDLWAEPEQFKPERFLDSNTPKPYTWIPFLQGSRKCIGYKLAIMQIKITLAMLVRDLKFSVIPSTSYKRKTHGISMSPVPDLKLRVEYLSA